MASNNKMMLVLPLMFLMNKVDFEDPTVLLGVRAAYVALQTLSLLANLYLWLQTKRTVDPKKITVETKLATGEKKTQEMTITEYDLKFLTDAVRKIVLSAVITGFIHYKWKIVQPLVLQAAMAPLELWDNKLMQIRVFGKSGEGYERPFKEAKDPMAEWLEKKQEEAREAQKELDTKQTEQQKKKGD